MSFRDRLTSRLWQTAAACAGIALLAAACGGSDNDSTAEVATPASTPPAAAASTASPTAAPTSAQSRTFVDATGKSFTIETPPKRVVALSPSAVELMFAVGATPIARPSSANYPEQAQSVTAVGSSYQPNFEQIAAQNPDFIIADAQIHSPQVIAELEKIGAPVFSIRVQQVADVMASLRLVGNIMGMGENGEKAAKALETKLQDVQTKLPPADQRPTVFLMIGTADAFWGAKPDAFAGDVIAKLGAKNLVESGPDTTQFPGFTSYSMEQLIALDPDVILVMSVSPNAPPTTRQLAGNPAWNGLRAVKEGRVYEVNTEALVQGAGPRVGEVIDTIYPILYPGR
ncbi:MAG: ABC transporter substrate-binding protein [Dehalococcoidia bacterium]